MQPSLSTSDFITHLFVRIDDTLQDQPHPVLSKLHLSEVVTLGCLFALKGRSFLAFYRWLKRDFLASFPQLPERSRLQRILEKYAFWCVDFLAQPSFFTVIDSYPIETIRPCRAGRSPNQLGCKSKDKGRWSVGLKLCWMVNDTGAVVNFGWSTMNAPDQIFHGLAQKLEGKTIVLADWGFRSRDGVPDNLKLCKKGTWNERMQVETALSMVTRVLNLKYIEHRVSKYVTAHLAYAVTVYNLLLEFSRELLGWEDSPEKCFRMSIAQFSL